MPELAPLVVPIEARIESVLMVAETGFLKREPAIALGIAGAVVSAVASTLVTHHIVGTVTASADTQQAVPAVAAALMLLFGAVLRHFVSPALPPLTPSDDDAPAAGGAALTLDQAALAKMTAEFSAGLAKLRADGMSAPLLLKLAEAGPTPLPEVQATEPTAPADPPVPPVPVQGDPTPPTNPPTAGATA